MRDLILGAMAASSMLIGCGGSSLTIAPFAQNKPPFPDRYTWVAQGSTPQLFTATDLMRFHATTAKGDLGDEVTNVQLECPSAEKELEEIDKNILEPNASTTSNKYFKVSNAPYEFLDLARQMGSFDSTIGVKPASLAVEASASKTTVYLALVYVNVIIEARQEFLDCVRESLTTAEVSGVVQVPSALAVGAFAILEFEAKRADGKVIGGYQDVLNAELEVSFSNAKATYNQWGQAKGLSAKDLLVPLSEDTPDAPKSLAAFREKIVKNGYVAIRRVSVTATSQDPEPTDNGPKDQ